MFRHEGMLPSREEFERLKRQEEMIIESRDELQRKHPNELINLNPYSTFVFTGIKRDLNK